ncbi:MAG: outer membrane beta-barrel protein [Gemmatimonadota bacterium]
MSRSIVLFPLVATLCIPALSQGQGPRFGIAIGKGLPAGDSRVVVDAGDHIVTGSGQAGMHIRGMLEWPLNSTAFAFRTEFFYNRLHSSSNTAAIVGDTVAKAALTDRTVGIMNSFVASLGPNAGVAPYFVVGAGVVKSSLGTNSDPQSNDVVTSRGGFGLGLQTGLGLRFRIKRTDLLVEWRYAQVLNNTRGAAYWPLTVGIRF